MIPHDHATRDRLALLRAIQPATCEPSRRELRRALGGLVWLGLAAVLAVAAVQVATEVRDDQRRTLRASCPQ